MSPETNSILVARPGGRLLGNVGWRDRESAATPPVAVIRGRSAVGAMRDLLVGLSERSGQAGVMDALELFLNAPSARAKIPHLILVGATGAATAQDVLGAVLLYEYQVAGWGTGAYATDDVTGERTVIAPPELRMEVAEIAGRALLRSGGLVALISLAGEANADGPRLVSDGVRYRVAVRRRQVPRYLKLADTYDATLATLGNDTRRNLRRYRQRLERDFGVEFVTGLRMERAEFLEMNRLSRNPMAEAVALWHLDAMEQMPGAVFCGLRANDGRWLSLLGGHRGPGSLSLDWQLNRAGLGRYSLSTGMRAFLLQHEVELGTEKLFFEGGTPHPMRHSFVSVEATDVIMKRPCAGTWLLRKLSRRIFPEKNFLGQVLRDGELVWREG